MDIVTAFEEQIKIWHGDQVRKYTGEPYWTHPVEVKDILKEHSYSAIPQLIALGHDLLEDTNVTIDDIIEFLYKSGDLVDFSVFKVCEGIQDLTDFFTKERFPNTNRSERKRLEARRIGNLCWETVKTIKLVDMYVNSKSIKEHDPKFWETYKVEKQHLLIEIGPHCDEDIRKMCYSIINN